MVGVLIFAEAPQGSVDIVLQPLLVRIIEVLPSLKCLFLIFDTGVVGYFRHKILSNPLFLLCDSYNIQCFTLKL